MQKSLVDTLSYAYLCTNKTTKYKIMKTLTHISTGTDEGNNTYKHVRVQDFTGSKTRVTNTYFLNGEKATKYLRWTVENWLENNINTELETIEKK